jgi:hypothetical protein
MRDHERLDAGTGRVARLQLEITVTVTIDPDYPELPEFLILKGRTDEERLADWAKVPYTLQGSNQSAADRAERGRSVAAALEEERREHNARGLERLKEKHRGERYDRKTRTWIAVSEGVEGDRRVDDEELQDSDGDSDGSR